MSPRFKNIAIVGVGLIGGCVARDVRERDLAGKITGYGRNAKRLAGAAEQGIIDSWHDVYNDSLAEADLVIVGTPVRAIAPIVCDIVPHLSSGAIVTDVGSVKKSIVDAVESRVPAGVAFIGGHPIAGTEDSGYESSFAGLFENRVCVLTPGQCSCSRDVDSLESFWRALGAEVVRMAPEEHDRIFAAISHLPHMVAFSLVNAIVNMQGFDSSILRYSAGGFRDFTRIAASDPVMWRDIAMMNRDNVLDTIKHVEDTLSELARAIEAGDENEIERLFQKSRDTRRSI
jgi:prephenate dehydrogenase